MKVIVDNKIPFIKEAIEKIADEVVYAPIRNTATKQASPGPMLPDATPHP